MNPPGGKDPILSFTLLLRPDEEAEFVRTCTRILEAIRQAKQNRIVESSAPAVTGPNAARLPASSPAPPAGRETPRDRWGIDKDGKEIAHAETDVEAYTVRIWNCTEGVGNHGKFLVVRWEQRRAYCHATNLFAWLSEAHQSKKQIVLYLTDADGNYPHIVGIRA